MRLFAATMQSLGSFSPGLLRAGSTQRRVPERSSAHASGQRRGKRRAAACSAQPMQLSASGSSPAAEQAAPSQVRCGGHVLAKAWLLQMGHLLTDCQVQEFSDRAHRPRAAQRLTNYHLPPRCCAQNGAAGDGPVVAAAAGEHAAAAAEQQQQAQPPQQAQRLEGARISVCGMTKRFNTKRGVFTAVEDVNVELEAGSITALVGPSGSGG